MKDVFYSAKRVPMAIAMASHILRNTGMAEEIQGMVKDALGRPLADVDLSLQNSAGEVTGQGENRCRRTLPV